MALETLPFESEAAAVQFVRQRLEPHCSSFVLEPVVNGRWRPDIGLRLTGLDFPFLIEVKRFTNYKQLRNLTDGVAQAAFYASAIQRPAFLAPFAGASMNDLHDDRRVPGAMMLAAQSSVGALMFNKFRDDEFAFALGGQIVVRVSSGTIHTRSDSLHLLTLKQRAGSQSWRREAN